MAQLEYNLPILILGSSKSLPMAPKAGGAVSSTPNQGASTVSIEHGKNVLWCK